MITKQLIEDACLFLKKNDKSISIETLDFILESSLQAYDECFPPDVVKPLDLPKNPKGLCLTKLESLRKPHD